MTNPVWILAQADINGPSMVSSESMTTDGGTTTTGTQVPADPNAPLQTRPKQPTWIWALWGVLLIMMYFTMFRGPKKKEQQHKQMIQALEKNDRVRTIGGIMGTVMDVKGDEVVLKVDEANNTKIRVAASAIGKNLTKEKQ